MQNVCQQLKKGGWKQGDQIGRIFADWVIVYNMFAMGSFLIIEECS
jgi:hypothetical protein